MWSARSEKDSLPSLIPAWIEHLLTRITRFGEKTQFTSKFWIWIHSWAAGVCMKAQRDLPRAGCSPLTYKHFKQNVTQISPGSWSRDTISCFIINLHLWASSWLSRKSVVFGPVSCWPSGVRTLLLSMTFYQYISSLFCLLVLHKGHRPVVTGSVR